jgi:MarR family transcriptional regulator, organic hydroperoxide resistance regulator
VDPLLELAISVKAAQRELERRQNEAMRPLGLTAAQADALLVIGQAGPLSLNELGELLIAEAGHPSRLVDRLVEGGWVERRAASDDRRRVELSLTASGRRLQKRILAARESTLELGRAVVGDLDLDPILDFFRATLRLTPFAELIERRRELEGRASGRQSPGRRPAR